MQLTRSFPYVVSVLSLTVPLAFAETAEQAALTGHLSTGSRWAARSIRGCGICDSTMADTTI